MRRTKNVDNQVCRINGPVSRELDLPLGRCKLDVAEFVRILAIINKKSLCSRLGLLQIR